MDARKKDYNAFLCQLFFLEKFSQEQKVKKICFLFQQQRSFPLHVNSFLSFSNELCGCNNTLNSSMTNAVCFGFQKQKITEHGRMMGMK